MNFQRVMVLVALMVATVFSEQANASIIAFGLSEKQFVNIPVGVKVCYLDTAHRLQDVVNAEVKTLSKVAALAWVSEHKPLLQKMGSGAMCLFLARDAHITKLPAIVKNNTSVVYGMTDVRAAIDRLQAKNNGTTGWYYQRGSHSGTTTAQTDNEDINVPPIDSLGLMNGAFTPRLHKNRQQGGQ